MRIHGVAAPLVLLLLLLVFFASVPAQAQLGLTSIWAVDDGEKIFRDDLANPLETGVNNSVWNGTSVSLFGAQNEVVAFQLILEGGATDVTNVNVQVSNLVNGASTIRGSHPLLPANDYRGMGVELFTEHYLNVATLSGDPATGYFNWSGSAAPAQSGMTTGWMPDALVPFSAAAGKGGAPFTVSANQNQGVWVDIYIAKGLPAGSYTGTVTVTVNGATAKTIPVSLQVLGLSLPDQNHYKTMIYYSDYCIDPRYGLTSTTQWPMLLEFNKLAHRHRLDLIGAGTWEEISNLPGVISGSAYTSAQNYDGPGVGVGNSVFSICTYGVTWTDTEAGYRTESDNWVNWFTANAPTVDYFLYLTDEPASSQYPWIQQRAAWVHNNPGPGHTLPVYVTKAVTDSLVGSIDIWGSPTASYDQAVTAAARARGEEVWPYAAYRPKSTADVIDDWGIAYRLKPWVAFKSDITRWFTWESTHYSRNPNEISPNSAIDVWTDPLTFHTTNASETGNGDGTLFYPGKDAVFPTQDRGFNGPIASYRMKMYRRGAQDYEYMWLAQQAGKGGEVQNVLQDLLPHVMDTAVTVPDWSNHDYPYEQARRELADLASGVSRAPSAKFAANVARGTSPLTVNFTDLSIFAPTSWSWNFGDGGTSTAQHPSHTYTGTGSFTVSLTTSNARGQDTETKTNYITLVQEVIVYPDSWATQGGRFATQIVSGSLTDVRQDDGVYLVTAPNNAAQRYSSQFNAHTGYTPSQVARITVEYQAKTSDSTQPGSTLLFMLRPDSRYNLVSDGAWTAGVTDTSYTWETTDIATYMNGSGLVGFEMCGCPSTKNAFQYSVDLMRWRLELKPASPVANFTANPTSGPAPLTVNFTDQSSNGPTSWSWAFGDGGTSTAQHPSHVYAAGTYTVSLTASNANGSDTNTKANYITASSGGPQDYLCSSLAVNTGTLSSGDHTSVHASDNTYLVVASARSGGKQVEQVSYTFATGLSSLSSLSFTVEGKVSAGTQPQTVSLYNYATSTWDSQSVTTLTTSDTTATATVAAPASYLSGGTVQVRVKTGGSGSTSYNHSTDLVKITAAP